MTIEAFTSFTDFVERLTPYAGQTETEYYLFFVILTIITYNKASQYEWLDFSFMAWTSTAMFMISLFLMILRLSIGAHQFGIF